VAAIKSGTEWGMGIGIPALGLLLIWEDCLPFLGTAAIKANRARPGYKFPLLVVWFSARLRHAPQRAAKHNQLQQPHLRKPDQNRNAVGLQPPLALALALALAWASTLAPSWGPSSRRLDQS